MARVVLQVDDSQFHRDLSRDQQTFHHTTSNMEHDLGRLGRGAIAGSGAFRGLGRSIAFASASFLGGVGLVAVVKSAITEAGSMNTQLARSNLIFGSSAKQIQEWSKTTYRSMGLARESTLTTANQFGTLLTSMGQAPAVAAKAAEGLTKVAAAISLARGEEDPAGAEKALAVALAGRGRALRQYGILLDQTTIKAEAMRLGLIKSTTSTEAITVAQDRLAIATAKLSDAQSKYGANTTQVHAAQDAVIRAHMALEKATKGSTDAITKQATAQAASSIVLHQGAKFVDDYGNLLNTSAGRMRRFHQGTKELREEIGVRLLPVFLNVIGAVNKFLASITEGGPRHAQFVKIMGQLGNVVRGAGSAFVDLFRAANRVAQAVGGWKTAIIGIVSAIAIVKGAWLAFNIAIRVQAAITAGVLDAALVSSGIGAVAVAFGLAAAYVITHWSKVSKWFQDFWIRLQVGSLRAYLHIIEPFSHLPGTLGEWARKAKVAVEDQIRDLGVQAALLSESAGEATGRAFLKGYNAEITKQGGIPLISGGKLVPQGPGGGTPGTLPKGGKSGSAITAIATGAAATAGAGSTGFHLPGERQPYDCSAFVQAVYSRAGISIGGNTYAQVKQGHHVDRGQLSPGDLIFMNFPGEKSPGHVGIYVGGGRMVHDHGAHGGVEQEGVPWSFVVDTRTYTTHGGPSVAPGLVDTTPTISTTPPSLTVGQTSKKREKAQLPGRLEDPIVRARTTRGLDDDLKAIDKAIDWVKTQLGKSGLGRKKRNELEKLLTQLNRERDADERKIEGPAPKAKKATVPGVYTGAVGHYGDTTSGTGRRTVVDPVLGKISVPITLASDVDDYKTLLKQLDAAYKDVSKKLKAAIKRRNQLTKALRKAERMKHRNPHLIKNLRQSLANINAQIVEYKSELSTLRQDIITARGALEDMEQTPGALPPELGLELAQEEAAGDIAGEISTLGKERDFIQGQLGRTDLTTSQRTDLTQQLTSINQQIKDLTQGLQDSREAALVDLPDPIKLALAQATLTDDTGDDLSALQAAEGYYTTALQTPGLSTAAKIALIDALKSVRDQIKNIQGATSSLVGIGEQNIVAFLAGLRDLREFQSNVWTPLPLGDSNGVNIVNNFAAPPPDPHLWSQGVQFDLAGQG